MRGRESDTEKHRDRRSTYTHWQALQLCYYKYINTLETSSVTSQGFSHLKLRHTGGWYGFCLPGI